VRRPAESVQFADGFPSRITCFIRRPHRNRALNAVFLDGHARLVSEAEWNRIDRDEQGYFFHLAAADR
jgi:prepilin-type processing-associated H-X9-DG protein